MLPRTSVGVDMDKELIEYMLQNVPNVIGVVNDVSKQRFKNLQFDLGVCNQVIEHTSNDEETVMNIRRSLRTGGILYISSIIREKGAWYPYKYEGEVRLSPKHVKEYSSLWHFTSLLQRHGFKILQACQEQYWLKCWTIPFRPSVPIPKFKRCEALVVKC